MMNHLRSCASLPSRLRNFVHRLLITFGWRYVAAVFLTYGCNQGFGEAFQYGATQYFLIDTLGLDPATTQQVQGFARMPWQVKPLFGMLSDLVPISGLHRAPYMLLAGVLGVVGNGMLMLLPTSAPIAFVGLLLLLSNVSFALPDVMIDATVAERAQRVPARTADMQVPRRTSDSLANGTPHTPHTPSLQFVRPVLAGPVLGLAVWLVHPRPALCWLAALRGWSAYAVGRHDAHRRLRRRARSHGLARREAPRWPTGPRRMLPGGAAPVCRVICVADQASRGARRGPRRLLLCVPRVARTALVHTLSHT
jgi:hypothetical protein